MAAPVLGYRFGPFALSLRARELSKQGSRLKVRPQPFQVLVVLLEHGGGVVTREELRARVWRADTFVDFEHGLNTAIKELRATLSDSATEPRYIETIPKVGYRMIVEVESAEPEGGPKAAIEVEKEVPPSREVVLSGDSGWPGTGREKAQEKPPTNLARRIAGVVVAILVIAGMGIGIKWMREREAIKREVAKLAAAKTGRVMLAVLPFQNLTGETGQEYFSDGLTEEMIAQLGLMDPEHFGVIARTSVMHYKSTQENVEQIGRELGVQYLLEGSVRRDGDTVRVTAQLIQAGNQTHLWSRQYDRQLSDLLTLQSELAREIGDEIQVTLGQSPKGTSSRAASKAPASSYESHDLYLKGRYYWNKRTEAGLLQAAQYFQEAVQKDANYAYAYAGLADTFALLGTWRWLPSNEAMPKARAAALKALQLDESLAEAHASLGLIAEQYDYDWQTAEREFRRAIELDPDYATGHQWYAEYLSLQGRFDEALAESERARQLDPLSLIIATDHGVILYYSRQYDRAIEQFRVVREMEIDFPRSISIYYAYIEKGDFAAALREVEDSGRRNHQENSPGTFARKAYVYGRWGRQVDAQHAFAKFEELSKRQQGSKVNPLWLRMEALMGVGRKSDAIGILEQESAEHSNALISLKVDPFLDPLREDPRFQTLLRTAHLAQ